MTYIPKTEGQTHEQAEELINQCINKLKSGAFIIFVAYKLFLRSRNGVSDDFADMISQLENFQQTDL